MNIEWRIKQTIYTNQNGMAGAIKQNKPLVKVVSVELAGSIGGARAISINGKWFKEADDGDSAGLEYEWNDAETPTYCP